ncbi:MAG: hypothetical protein ACJ74Q_05475 [Pyrinomonadaceae bacterium]
MTTIPRGEQTVISRLRVGGAVRDPIVARLRLESMLGAAELRPRSLPSSAILCVRKLCAPRGALGLARGGAYASHAQHEWQRALSDALDRVAARAVRPFKGPTPHDAEAVVFADRAELLACLALDWRARLVASRWWWRDILRGADAARAVTAEWLGSPEYVPAALEHLSRAGMAAEFVAALDVDEVSAMTRRIAQVFGLGDLFAALSAASARDERTDENAVRARDASAEERRLRPDSSREATAAPLWERFAPESRERVLDARQALLLGLGLTLARAPLHARSQAFARDVGEWLGGLGSDDAPFVSHDAAAESSLEERSDPASRTTGVEVESASASEASAARTLVEDGESNAIGRTRTDAREPKHLSRPKVVETSNTPRRVESRQSSSDEELNDDEESRAEIKASVEGSNELALTYAHESGPRSRTDVTDLHTSRTPSESAVTKEPSTHAPPLLEACVETRLGGLFYLINVGLFLELYGDFTTPLRPGLALSVWDFVALVGRRLCGAGFETDAVWPLLARLAGRVEGESPGHDFEPPTDWLVPPLWLAPFPEHGVWHWHAEEGRLRVRHQEEFVLLDVAARGGGGGDASLEARDATDAYAAVASFELRRDEADDGAESKPLATVESKPLVTRDGARLECWVERVAAYVRARLRRALGVDDAHALARLLFEQEARITLTAARVEVLLQLARLPVEVRLSGLDRDPGWVPAAGRFVAFRYE